jgi:hypothetical protein
MHLWVPYADNKDKKGDGDTAHLKMSRASNVGTFDARDTFYFIATTQKYINQTKINEYSMLIVTFITE